MSRWISIILQIIIGALFVVSALTKLYPIEEVELYIYSLGIFSWSSNEIAVRILIMGELAIGLLLISHAYRRHSLLVTLGVLMSMSFFLLYTIMFMQSDNCHCFGEVLPMTPLESLAKNAILIIATAYLMWRGHHAEPPYQKHIAVALILASVSYVLVVNKPDSWMDREKLDRPMADNEFAAHILPDSLHADALSGKRIMCFFSMRCKFCFMAAHKMSVIQERYGKDAGIRYFFFGDERFMPFFWNESKSNKYPTAVLPDHIFFSISDNQMPTIFLVEDGIIKGKFGYRGLTEEVILDFLNAPAQIE